jgi:hypothetical protein
MEAMEKAYDDKGSRLKLKMHMWTSLAGCKANSQQPVTRTDAHCDSRSMDVHDWSHPSMTSCHQLGDLAS